MKNILSVKLPHVFIGMLFSIIVLSLFIGASSAKALSCITPTSNADFITNGSTIFEGTVISNIASVVIQSSAPTPHKVTFKVSKAWGGSISTPFEITDNIPVVGGPPYGDNRDPWGFRKTFDVGKKYIVYASREGSSYKADIGGCDRSQKSSQRMLTILSSELGQGYTPIDTVTPVTQGLLAQIQSLLALVASLQQQLAQSVGGDIVAPVIPISPTQPRLNFWWCNAYKDVSFGMSSKRVLDLHNAMGTQILGVSPTGYYGNLTNRAWQRWCSAPIAPPITPPVLIEDPATNPECKSWYDGCNSCSRSNRGEPAMCTQRYCIQQSKPYCTEYFSSVDEHRPPTIHSFSGPTQLNINQRGTWIVRASDSQNGQLTYSVDWGDRGHGGWNDTQSASSAYRAFTQATTFTYLYSNPGTYTVRITVRNQQGKTAVTTQAVKVIGDVVDRVVCITLYAPVCGFDIELSKIAKCASSTKNCFQKTYSNTCNLSVAKAKFLYYGSCDGRVTD